jgi:tetratricopeptide (TPR) repeat protein
MPGSSSVALGGVGTRLQRCHVQGIRIAPERTAHIVAVSESEFPIRALLRGLEESPPFTTLKEAREFLGELFDEANAGLLNEGARSSFAAAVALDGRLLVASVGSNRCVIGARDLLRPDARSLGDPDSPAVSFYAATLEPRSATVLAGPGLDLAAADIQRLADAAHFPGQAAERIQRNSQAAVAVIRASGLSAGSRAMARAGILGALLVAAVAGLLWWDAGEVPRTARVEEVEPNEPPTVEPGPRVEAPAPPPAEPDVDPAQARRRAFEALKAAAAAQSDPVEALIQWQRAAERAESAEDKAEAELRLQDLKKAIEAREAALGRRNSLEHWRSRATDQKNPIFALEYWKEALRYADDPSARAEVEKTISELERRVLPRAAPSRRDRGLSAGDATFEFRWIAPGSFMMGSPEGEAGRRPDERRHFVHLTRGYWIQSTEVTRRQWRAVRGGDPDRRDPDLPVDATWEEAKSFAEALGRALPSGERADLPTEAEWEFACRAGSTARWCFGDDPDRLEEYAAFADDKPRPVALGRPNRWGLYDMHGNVEEWCADGYAPYGGSARDPVGPARAEARVLRGGDWKSPAGATRSASRSSGTGKAGFRVVIRKSP